MAKSPKGSSRGAATSGTSKTTPPSSSKSSDPKKESGSSTLLIAVAVVAIAVAGGAWVSMQPDGGSSASSTGSGRSAASSSSSGASQSTSSASAASAAQGHPGPSGWQCDTTEWLEPGQAYLTSCGTADGARKYPWAGACFGYEDNCTESRRYAYPTCPSPSEYNRAGNKEQREKTFWEQGDFGLVSTYRKQLRDYCAPRKDTDDGDAASSGDFNKQGSPVRNSRLTCSTNLRYCRAENLFIDLRNVKKVERKGFSGRLDEEYYKVGQLGGDCALDETPFLQQSKEPGSLQSWWNELRNYRGSEAPPKCDVWIEKPTLFLKLDALINMYHHFCDYINIWLTQHVWGHFDRDINIWDHDVSYMPHTGYFEKTFEAFTSNTPLMRPKDYEGKVVCFREAVFGLGPRVRLSLYYNMFLESGCHGSSLFRTFRDVVLRRLAVPVRKPGKGTAERPFRVVFSSRKGTRKVLNERELMNVLNSTPNITVKRRDYGTIPFLPDQLETTANADIFIGMHGAGLTHVLFQPYPAVMWELHNCQDRRCYLDLTRLTGNTYMTWNDQTAVTTTNATAHQKFVDYTFDPDAFRKRLNDAIEGLKKRRGSAGYDKEDIVEIM